MDGLFSPVATWMLRRDGLAGGALFTACPQGDPSGACSFGYFACTQNAVWNGVGMRSITRRADDMDVISNKKSNSPVATSTRNGVLLSRRAK